MRPIPPLYFLAALFAMVALHRSTPLEPRLPGAFDWVGFVSIGAGIALAIWAAGLFGRHGTTVHPHGETTALVVTGPYRFTRNPMYVGLVLVLVGVAFVLGSITPWLVPLPFALAIERSFVRPEEARLRERFGEEYEAYCRRVRRWI